MVSVVSSGVVDVLMVGDREGVVKIDGCRLLCDLLCERCLSKLILVKYSFKYKYTVMNTI
jgi:hypothetical protein